MCKINRSLILKASSVLITVFFTWFCINIESSWTALANSNVPLTSISGKTIPCPGGILLIPDGIKMMREMGYPESVWGGDRDNFIYKGGGSIALSPTAYDIVPQGYGVFGYKIRNSGLFIPPDGLDSRNFIEKNMPLGWGGKTAREKLEELQVNIVDISNTDIPLYYKYEGKPVVNEADHALAIPDGIKMMREMGYPESVWGSNTFIYERGRSIAWPPSAYDVVRDEDGKVSGYLIKETNFLIPTSGLDSRNFIEKNAPISLGGKTSREKLDEIQELAIKKEENRFENKKLPEGQLPEGFNLKGEKIKPDQTGSETLETPTKMYADSGEIATDAMPAGGTPAAGTAPGSTATDATPAGGSVIPKESLVSPEADGLIKHLAQKENYLAQLKQHEKDEFESLYGDGENKIGLTVDQIGNRIAQQLGINPNIGGSQFGERLNESERDWTGRQADWLKKHNEFMREQLNGTRKEIKTVEQDIADQRKNLESSGISNVDELLKEERKKDPDLKNPADIKSPDFFAKLKEDALNAASDATDVSEFLREALTYVQTPGEGDYTISQQAGVTGPDGLQHKLNDQGRPVALDQKTGEWKEDTTPYAFVPTQTSPTGSELPAMYADSSDTTSDASPSLPDKYAAEEELAYQTNYNLALGNQLASLKSEVDDKDGYKSVYLSQKLANKTPDELTEAESKYLNLTREYIDSGKKKIEMQMNVYPDQIEKLNKEYTDWLKWEQSLDNPGYEPRFNDVDNLVRPTGGVREINQYTVENARQNYEQAQEKFKRGEITEKELDDFAKRLGGEQGAYRAKLHKETPETPEFIALKNETDRNYQEALAGFNHLKEAGQIKEAPPAASDTETIKIPDSVKLPDSSATSGKACEGGVCPISKMTGEELLNPPAPREAGSAEEAFNIFGRSSKTVEMFKASQELAKDYENLNEEQKKFVDDMGRLISYGKATTEEELKQKWLAETGNSYSKNMVQEQLNAWKQLEKEQQSIISEKENAYESKQLPEGQLPEGFDVPTGVPGGIQRSATDLPYVNEGDELVVPNGREIPNDKVPTGGIMSQDDLKTTVIPSDRYVKLDTDDNGITTYLLSNGGIIKSDGSSNFNLATEGSAAQQLYEYNKNGKDPRTWGEYLDPRGPTLQQKVDGLKEQVRKEGQEREMTADELYTRFAETAEETNPERNNMFNSNNLPKGFTVDEQKVDPVEAKKEELAYLSDSLIKSDGELNSLRDQLGKKDSDYLSIAQEINKKAEAERISEEQQFLDKFSETTNTSIKATETQMGLYPEDSDKLREEYFGWKEVRNTLNYKDHEPIKELVEATGMYRGLPGGGDRTEGLEGESRPDGYALPPSKGLPEKGGEVKFGEQGASPSETAGFPTPKSDITSPYPGGDRAEGLGGSPPSNIVGYWSAYSEEGESGEIIGGGYVTHDKNTGEVNVVANPMPFDASDRRSTWETWAPEILGGKTIEQKNAEVEAARNEAVEKQKAVIKETYEKALKEPAEGEPGTPATQELTEEKSGIQQLPSGQQKAFNPDQWQRSVNINEPPPGSLVNRTPDLTGEREGSCSGDRTEKSDDFWKRPEEEFSPLTPQVDKIGETLPPYPTKPSDQPVYPKSAPPYLENFVRPVPVDPNPPNGTLEKPYELTDEAIAKIFSFDSENNKISMAEDWKDKLDGIGGRDIHIKMSDEQIADALERQGKMTKDEKEKFAKSGKTEVPDGTPVIDPKTNKEAAPDRDSQPDKTRGNYSDEYIIRS